MIKSIQKSHGVILASILESSIKLTTCLTKAIDLIIPILVMEASSETTSLMDTRSDLSVLDTNLKFLEVKIESEFKNDNELFLDVVRLLESDVLPIFNQSFKLITFVSTLESLKTVISEEDEKFTELLEILKKLMKGDSFENLISKFDLFLTKCLKYSMVLKSNSYNEISSFKKSDLIKVFSYQGSIKSSFDYESEYYSLSSKLHIINDLLMEFDICLQFLEDKDESTEDDIFGFEFEKEINQIDYPKKFDLNYNSLNFRQIIMH